MRARSVLRYSSGVNAILRPAQRMLWIRTRMHARQITRLCKLPVGGQPTYSDDALSRPRAELCSFFNFNNAGKAYIT